MKLIKDERGLTLIEVLVSIVLLSIMFISLMNFFPQMGKVNLQNQDKTQAINSAKEVLLLWQSKTNAELNPIFAQPLVNGYHTLSITTPTNEKARIKIDPNSRGVESKRIKLHQIKVEILDKKDNVVSETYGYVKRIK